MIPLRHSQKYIVCCLLVSKNGNFPLVDLSLIPEICFESLNDFLVELSVLNPLCSLLNKL